MLSRNKATFGGGVAVGIYSQFSVADSDLEDNEARFVSRDAATSRAHLSTRRARAQHTIGVLEERRRGAVAVARDVAG